jgi:tetratricopeptide (TPR) repeat protein/DNA-binding MarR family transcriptional regulator
MHNSNMIALSDTPTAQSHGRSQVGLYRSWLTSPAHRAHITVGRASLLQDTIDTLRANLGKKPKRHQLFIAPRGSGKTHFLSLIEDAINSDSSLSTGYVVVRFPEEAHRVCSFADFLLAICEILRNQGAPWDELYARLSTEVDDKKISDVLTKAIRTQYRETGKILLLMVENLNQILEQQMKKTSSIQSLRGFFMGDNGCLLIATSPVHFGAHTKPNAPFYDFFDTQVLDALSAEDTIALIRRNLEWDERNDLLDRFSELRPRLLAIHTMTGGSPRLTMMLYELISSESITAVRDQFLMLQDRITPFYQDRMKDLSPQERAVMETIATMRDAPGSPAPRKTPVNIARLMRMSQAKLASHLSRLTKSLYLTARDNPDDKRSTIYTIREGFFDLWLAMNLSRASARRIPLIGDFFASYYEQEEARRLKREEYWQRLHAGEFTPDTTENLSYLSNVGKPHEQAEEKIKLINAVTKAGDTECASLLKEELCQLPLDTTGKWITAHADDLADNPLDEIAALIATWQTHREGNLEAFATKLKEMGESLDYKGWSKLKIEFLTDHIDAVPLSAERVEARLRLAKVLRRYAKWQEAEPQSHIALQEAEQLKNEYLISWALNDHAQLLKETNRMAEAEPLMKRALAIDEASYGDDHPNVAISLNNLAQLLQDTNRMAEAEPLMKRALAIDEASYGDDHPKLAIRLNNLAGLLQATNRMAEAEPLMRRALAIDEASYGEDHPNVAIRLNNLVVLLQATNRMAEAKPLMRRALAIDEASYREDHPNVAIRLNNLAQLLQDTNHLAEAEPLMRRALAIDEASYGEDHPNVAIDLNNLAQLLQDTNRLAEAEPLMRRALCIFFKSLGHENPNTITAENNYRYLLAYMERSEEEIVRELDSIILE